MISELALTFETTHTHGHCIPLFAFNRWPLQNCGYLPDLRLRPVAHLKDKVPNQYRQDRLQYENKEDEYSTEEGTEEGLTLNSAAANSRPRHILGPSMKDKR